ncbi:MAG TPA: Sec-independent protein translocase subunit TatA [Aldersonia sp.]
MGAMSPWHWAIVLLVLLLLFSSKKLPDIARGLGRSLRIFKSEMNEMQNDGGYAPPAEESQQTITQPKPMPSAPPQQHTDLR